MLATVDSGGSNVVICGDVGFLHQVWFLSLSQVSSHIWCNKRVVWVLGLEEQRMFGILCWADSALGWPYKLLLAQIGPIFWVPKTSPTTRDLWKFFEWFWELELFRMVRSCFACTRDSITLVGDDISLALMDILSIFCSLFWGVLRL